MSKKMLKRSLALGALMAFVITGQAWAAEHNGSLDVTGTNNYDSDLTVNASSYGIFSFDTDGTMNVDGDLIV